MSKQKYKVVRTFIGPHKKRKTLHRGLSLEDAEKLVRRPCSSSATDLSQFGKRLRKLRGEWVDTYEPDNPPTGIRMRLRKKGFDV
jgi:hypothetical protein